MKQFKIYSDTIEQSALDQFRAAMALPCTIQGALMPDSHQGYSLPIGAVVKTKNEIFPAFVGSDIGCGIAYLELDINYKTIDLEALKTYILKTIPIGFSSHDISQSVEGAISFEGTSQILQDIYSTKGTKQLGTLGGGNHFIEVGYLESNENIAIVVHSGSRGFGHGVASHYMREAANQSVKSNWGNEHRKHLKDFAERNEEFMNHSPEKYKKVVTKYITKQKAQYMKKQDIEGLHSFNVHSVTGKQYLVDQNFCLSYASLNRKHMINVVASGILHQFSTIKHKRVKFIDCNHNHAEVYNSSAEGAYVGEIKEIIHRKGATHAELGMMGVIPGNMRDGSFIVKGKGSPDSLCSSSHGAGRVLSRKRAKATLDLEEFKTETVKLVTNHTDEMLDEAPKAYKDIFEVMRLQSDLVEVIDRVIPILNIKG